MKKIPAVLLIMAFFISSTAQVPEKLSFQAVIRDSQNKLVNNTNVGIQISILQGSGTGSLVYTEVQNPVTNENGLVSIEIGGGSGFSSIDWSDGPYFIKIETDPTGGTNYSAIVGTSQLLSVPYSLHSKTTEIEYDPLFSAHPVAGISELSINNWNIAFIWGNHANAGYQTLVPVGTTSQYWRGDKTWQSLDKTAVGLGSVENTALSTWTGSTSILTLGTVSSGIWNAGAVTSSGTITGGSIVKTGGTSDQFLKADGSVDANTYMTVIQEAADEFTAGAGQTSFTLTNAPASTSKVKMYINGVRISNSAYNHSGATLSYIPSNNGSYSLTAGDRIQFDYHY